MQPETTDPAVDAATDTATDALAGTTTGSGSWVQDNLDTIIAYAMPAIGCLVILFVAWIISGWVAVAIRKAMGKAKIDETLTKFSAKLAKWAILLFAALGCLGMFGISVASFAAVLAAAGFAIGLAFQGTLSNFSAGVMLLVFRPFSVGQVVSVAGVTGKVDEIGLFTTTMDTPDNRRLIVPNGSIFGSLIENISYHSERRVDVAVGTDYSADLDQTRAVLEKAVASVDGQCPGREPAIVLAELGASSIDWAVRIWVPAGDFFPKKEELTHAIKVNLDEAQIGIPFPQMDVHFDGVPAMQAS